jgi:hypothetical protein
VRYKCNNVAYMSRRRFMSVRKRAWKRGGEVSEAWVVDFRDATGRRRLKTFTSKAHADRFSGVCKAVGSGAVPEPLTKGYRPIEFTAEIPGGGWRRGAGRQMVADALRAAHTALVPTHDAVVVHVVAEMPPSCVIADVDNLLKPVLDSLKGVAWIDDTQVCELLVRRIPGRHRRLHIKIWQIPGPTLNTYLNALAESRLIEPSIFTGGRRGALP